MAFPNITPSTLEVEYENDTISTSYDGGYEQRRNRNTRQIKKFSATYIITTEQKDLLKAHYEDVTTVIPFNWISEEDGVSHTVRYEDPLIIPMDKDFKKVHTISIKVKEV